MHPALNTLSLRKLRTFVGKRLSVASVLYAWCPFVHTMYAALFDESMSNAPQGCIWTKHIHAP